MTVAIQPGRARSVPWDMIVPAVLFAVAAFGTLRTLATGLWVSDDHVYSPIILAVALIMSALILRRDDAPPRKPANVGLILMLACGIAIVIGYLLNNIFLRASGLLAMAAGLVIYLSGWRALARYALPFLILCFALPLPGSLINTITFPLKMGISSIATALMSGAGLPVSSEGVIIDIGNYRLLVADACSGLQSMFSLMAVAIAYIFMSGERDPLRAGVLIVSAVPVVFALNVLRVVALALITYWFGNQVGEGVAHGAAGMVMFVLAFLGLMAIDAILERIWPRRTA